MSKVIFFFAGTGNDGSENMSDMESQTFQSDVIRIYIKGCHEERVGNGFLFPDLDIVANNVRGAFEGKELDLDKLKANLGDGLLNIFGVVLDKKIKVDDITLEGFSRGAVTTFATAKKLNDLNIPMNIIADQPVSGESTVTKGGPYSRYCDLRDCHNIKSAYTFLASCNLEQGFIHNYFYRQMVAKFSPEVNAQQILFPHQNHLCSDSPIAYHIGRLMTRYGLILPSYNSHYEAHIKNWYRSQSRYFTPYEFMQPIYGADGPINKDPIYLAVLIENANTVLTENNMNFQSINHEQAAAIVSIATLPDEDMDGETKITLFKLVLKNAKPAGQFVKIVNKVTEICDHLHITTNDSSNKSYLIKLYSGKYKKSVFLSSFAYLLKDNPNEQDKKDFASNIYKAECEFREQALGMDRDNKRIILKLLTNFITHITGLALIVNTINKVTTGNWLLFQHNRSENVVRDNRKALLGDLDKLDFGLEPTKNSL